MPITKSAKKALRQTHRRTERNAARKTAYKDAMKRIRKLIAANKKPEAERLTPDVYRAIDKAAKAGVIKRNAAARYKSQVIAWLRSPSAVKS